MAWAAVAMALVGTLAIAGCSLGGASAAAGSGPPPDAAAVLQRVKSFAPKDASFKVHAEGASDGKAIYGGVMGQVITNPARADLIYNLTLDGQQVSFEAIVDQDTKSEYAYYTIPTKLHTGLWVKQTAQSGTLTNVTSLVDWSNISDVTMVGPDNLGNLNVWHLRGSDTKGGFSALLYLPSAGTVAQDDIYVDQTDFHPVQMIIKTTGTGTDTLTLTVTYTAYNSGLHIDLPPASRVQSG